MKRTKRIAAITAVLLLILILVLPLLIQYASLFSSSNVKIPEGWEVVSTDGNVTYIQMKEGSSAYHWMDTGVYPHTQDYPLLDWEIPGNPNMEGVRADRNGNVKVIIYYGYMNVRYNTFENTYHLYTQQNRIDNCSYQLRMYRQEDRLDKVFIHFDNDFITENTLAFQYDPANESYPQECRVGFTRAILVDIPLSDFPDNAASTEFCITTTYPTSPYFGITEYERFETCKFSNILFFSHADLSQYLNTFPLSLFNRYSDALTAIFFLSALVIMVISAILNKSPRLHRIPCIIGAVHNTVKLLIEIGLPNLRQGMFAGFYSNSHIIAGLLFMYFLYFAWNILLLRIRTRIDAIRRRKMERQALSVSEPPDPPQ